MNCQLPKLLQRAQEMKKITCSLGSPKTGVWFSFFRVNNVVRSWSTLNIFLPRTVAECALRPQMDLSFKWSQLLDCNVFFKNEISHLLEDLPPAQKKTCTFFDFVFLFIRRRHFSALRLIHLQVKELIRPGSFSECNSRSCVLPYGIASIRQTHRDGAAIRTSPCGHVKSAVGQD